ncbi:uncharacterized protein LOC132042200 [Lycium ferocissimum]|uniref:uncharacterized protein LOC132042200 n=1 Tax=Lycium ferocissimum TaxID=112874 RepID=UPI0028166DA0|nr:uncharacterized protein LOC132042200 [Lycium ferocissimum]
MGDRMHQFVSGLGPHLIKDYFTASLQEGMDISRIQAHAQNLEEQQQQHRGERDIDRGHSKRARSVGASQSLKVSLIVSGSQFEGDPGQRKLLLPRCSQCDILHSGQFYRGSDACYAYGQIGHMMPDCPSMSGRGGAQPTGSAAGSSSSVHPVGQTP